VPGVDTEEQQIEDIAAYERWCAANGLELVLLSDKGWLRQGHAEPTPYTGVAQTSPETAKRESPNSV
jgi:hypothetical protein